MSKKIKYAGFIVRVFAAIIDGLILSIPMKFIESIFGYESIYTIVIILLLWWFYSSYMNYKYKGTIGKRILGLEILDTNRNSITFKQSSIRFVISIFSYVLVFPVLMMIINKNKQTFHDYLSKTIVKDYLNEKKHKKKFLITKIFKYLGMITIVVVSLFILYKGIYLLSFFSDINEESRITKDLSYTTVYVTKDFNDSVIIFYQHELEEYSKKFIDANDMYEIFESRIKYGLALDCINTHLDIYTKDIEMLNGYRRNARNKYLDSEEKVKKSKNNEAYLFKYEDIFDFRLTHQIIDNMLIMNDDINNTICNQKYPVKKIYKLFFEKYISLYYKKNVDIVPYDIDIQQQKWYEILVKNR